jgi:hypothetical protein
MESNFSDIFTEWSKAPNDHQREALWRDLKRGRWLAACRSAVDQFAAPPSELLEAFERVDPAAAELARSFVACANMAHDAITLTTAPPESLANRAGDLVSAAASLLGAVAHVDGAAKILDQHWPSEDIGPAALAERALALVAPASHPSAFQRDLIYDLLGEPLAASRELVVNILLTGGRGEVAALRLERVDPGQRELYPAPTCAFLPNSEFTEATLIACEYIQQRSLWPAQSDIRWSIERRGQEKLPSQIAGASAGFAIALGMAKLLAGRDDRLARLDLTGVAYTAAFTRDGNLQPIGQGFDKLLAAARERSLPRIHTVVVAAEQRPDIERIDRTLLDAGPSREFRVIAAARFDEAVDQLLADGETRWGQILDCSDELQPNPHFIQRKWASEAMSRFFAQQHGGYFLIVGAAGTGKSALVADFIRKRPQPVYHFIRKGKGYQDDPYHIFTSLIAQLRQKYVLPSSPSQLYGGEMERRDPAEAKAVEFYELLRKLSGTLSEKEPEVIWLDGLDEAYGPLSRLPGVALPGALRAKLPDHIYMVLTSRPGEHLTWLGNPKVCTQLDLHGGAGSNSQEVREYFELRNREERLELPGPLLDEAVRKSDGNFLYAVHVIDWLKGMPPAERTIDKVPDGLRGLMAAELEAMVAAWAAQG